MRGDKSSRPESAVSSMKWWECLMLVQQTGVETSGCSRDRDASGGLWFTRSSTGNPRYFTALVDSILFQQRILLLLDHILESLLICADCCLLFLQVSCVNHAASELTGQWFWCLVPRCLCVWRQVAFNVVASQLQPFCLFITTFDARFVLNTDNRQYFFLFCSIHCQNSNSVITDIIIAIFGHLV